MNSALLLHQLKSMRPNSSLQAYFGKVKLEGAHWYLGIWKENLPVTNAKKCVVGRKTGGTEGSLHTCNRFFHGKSWPLVVVL